MEPNVAVEIAVRAISEGRMVLVADNPERENEGDLVMAAEHIVTADMIFFLRHGSGIVCTPMSSAIADELGLEPMASSNTDNFGTAFTTSVDAVGTRTGISAIDRTVTVRALACVATQPSGLRRPGHIFPLRARAGGVLERDGHTEAAIELMQMAGCRSVAVITELVDDDGIPLSGERLSEFAFRHDIPFITVDALVDHCKHAQDRLNLSGPTVLPTEYGTFHARSYLSIDEGVEHLVLTYGPIDDLMKQRPGVLARVHSECMTGDLIRSRRCDCGTQLDSALQMIVSEGAGVLIYMRGHEGRGIGLGPKLSAYTLQDAGYDTVDANTELGLPVDDRDYSAAVAILHALDVRRVRLITNNPDKVEAIEGGGVRVVGNVTVPADVTDENIAYLLTKRERMGHSLQLPTKSDSIAE